ncbi:MAG: hypothetical protein M0Z39_10215 [Actinomycetota bacterium]|nr:hypothetical protein [Actinomycetota bacterium]
MTNSVVGVTDISIHQPLQPGTEFLAIAVYHCSDSGFVCITGLQ